MEIPRLERRGTLSPQTLLTPRNLPTDPQKNAFSCQKIPSLSCWRHFELLPRCPSSQVGPARAFPGFFFPLKAGISFPRRRTRRGEAAEHKSCHSTAAEWGQQRWQLNFPSNKAPVFMQISLRNEIPAKRKADNVLCKQNYLGTDGFFQGFGVYPWGFFFCLFWSPRRLGWGQGGDGGAGVYHPQNPSGLSGECG